MRRRARHIAVLTSVCTVLLFAGCTEEVAAPTGVEEPFSMYGIINPRLNQQTLLVSPIEVLLEPLDESIDAVVTSTDLETGETVVWEDSVVWGESGQLDHVFIANFRARFGGSYRVNVERSDGAASSAEANVPDEVEITSTALGMQMFDVNISGEAFHLLDAEVIYTVRRYKAGMSDQALCQESQVGSFGISYADDLHETEDGFRFRVNLDLDHERVMNLYRDEYPFYWRPSVNGLALMNVQVSVLVAEPAWAPVGGANVQADPNVMTNVSNGFGFVGGGYNESRRIYPSRENVDATWFFDYLMRPPGECLDYCVCGWQ